MPSDSHTKTLKNYRGRRLLTCRAADTLGQVVAHLGVEEGTTLPAPGKEHVQPPSDALRHELDNAVTNLMRLILAVNDGGCSPSKLNKF